MRPQAQPPCPGGLDAPTAAREQGLPSYGFPASFGDRRFPKGERKAFWCVRRRSPLAPGGLTRRLRRELGLAILWGVHTFLSLAKEKCAKESQRHGDSGKKPFIAHFDGGARYVARSTVELPTWTFVRARAHSFPLSKRARLFPSAAYRRPRPRGRRKAYASLAGWDALAWRGQFSRATSRQGFKAMLAFGASRETFRRAAVTPQPSCFPTGIPAPYRRGVGCRGSPPAASREARRRAAVTPQPSCMSPYAPARLWRAVRMGLSPYPCKKGFMEERRSKIRSGLTSLVSTSCREASPVSTRMLRMPKLRPVAMSVYRRSPTMASSSF